MNEGSPVPMRLVAGIGEAPCQVSAQGAVTVWIGVYSPPDDTVKSWFAIVHVTVL
jgi:hypothetical protein